MANVTISTSRLILRPLTFMDVDPLYTILSEKDILQYFPESGPLTRERVEKIINRRLEHWQKHGYGWWALETKAGGELIGWCGLLYLPETDEVEVGYLIKHSHWRQGLATESSRTSLAYGFDKLGIDRIVGIVHPANIASQRVLEKISMRFVDRNNYFGMPCFRYEKTLAMHRFNVRA
ncbi:MAG: GNAT family N-acetyltransferase [Anaerolineales bacterium]|nr:GNAT family N-acetyltransferase [Anaerolineales bacterium]